jgi:hypothetical protein
VSCFLSLQETFVFWRPLNTLRPDCAIRWRNGFEMAFVIVSHWALSMRKGKPVVARADAATRRGTAMRAAAAAL